MKIIPGSQYLRGTAGHTCPSNNGRWVVVERARTDKVYNSTYIDLAHSGIGARRLHRRLRFASASSAACAPRMSKSQRLGEEVNSRLR